MLKQPLELLNDKERPLHRRSFPICPKCNQTCSKEDGSFVRAFNQVYHNECFVCEDCLVPVANKYYTMEDQPKHARKRKAVLCEYHHLKRLDLICIKCDKPTTTEQPHPECIQCPSCVTPTVHQYEFKGQSYCRLHYSLILETHCAGCDQAILKQFVEHRDLPDQIWHPECYMIFKFWGVKLTPKHSAEDTSKIIAIQKELEHKVIRVWTDLSSFEESSANCISDMLLNVAAGAYKEGVRMANQFIMHLEVLFSALDLLQQHYTQNQDAQCIKDANSICQQMIRFFQLLTIPTNTDIAITQELLSLVTGLAQNLKSLIRFGLKSALHLERDIGIQNAIPQFLDQLLELEKKRVWIAGRYWFKDPPSTAIKEDLVQECTQCHLPIQDTACYQCQPQHIKWHPGCFKCSICSTPLDDQTARLQGTTLFCQSCCIEDPSFVTCTRVSSLEQCLIGLKLYLANTTATTNEDKKLPNEMMMPEAKRQRSILRLLGNRTLQNQRSANKVDRLSSIHMGQIGHNSSTTLDEASFKKKANKNLVISTTGLDSPVSPLISPVKGNRLADSIRRTFSTSSQHGKSFHGVFDRHRKREARRASILTMDDSGRTVSKCVYISTLTPSQDFIVRHAAVIAIEPLITPPFSLNELVDLIDTKKKKSKTSKRKSSSIDNHSQNPASLLWGKLITHIKAPPNTLQAPVTSHHTFGVALATVAERDRAISLKSQEESKGVTLRDFTPSVAASFSDNALIPIFVKSCIMVILQSDMSIEGVFRKNGNIRQLNELSETIDQQEQTLVSMESLLVELNPIQLAALLKRYLRELPEPLFTFDLYPLFLRCGRMQNNHKVLHLACCLLPKPNRDTMLLLFCCLKWVATFSDTNKMDIPNLARVIAPSVLFEKSSQISNSAADLRQGAQEEINIIETLIRLADDISKAPTDLTVLTLNDIHQDMTGLNSKYFIHHYQQLLNDLRNQKSKSANNSPLSTATPKSSTLLLKHHIGIPKLSSFTTSPIPSASTTASVTSVPTPTKQRRTSWIPGLIRK